MAAKHRATSLHHPWAVWLALCFTLDGAFRNLVSRGLDLTLLQL
jgi:hypothetical protein